ncbi:MULTISPECIES: protocatechuate 3,4-dioxygenase subunit beta [Cupriavidus]
MAEPSPGQSPQLAQYRRPYWDTQPPYRFDPYASTHLRSPQQPLVVLPQTLSEVTGPLFGAEFVRDGDSDLTTGTGRGEAIGERILVSGRVLDENGRPVPDALIEVWQANAAGRYVHKRDQHDAPLDPNFSGAGRCATDAQGRYQFKTIRPGAYPWRNHHNAWRPQHIHFSLFGNAYATRLVTQMYFPGDPLLACDPIFNCVPDARARERLVSVLDWETTVPEYALGYRFDIVLRGRDATPME